MKNKHKHTCPFQMFWKDYNILNDSILLLLLYYMITAVFIKTFKCI